MPKGQPHTHVPTVFGAGEAMFTPGAHDYASLAPLCMHAACRLSMHSGGCEWCAQPTQGVTVGFGVCPTAKHTTYLLLQCWMCSHMWAHIC